VSSVILFLIGFVAPWAVHLVPPRQRPVALVGVVLVLLLFAIFAGRNPVTAWELWVGLLAGVIAVLVLVAGGFGRRRPRRGRGRPRREPVEAESQPTELL
jgi:peptidoglycan/LPS O-acetylase OafA/YrhL